MISLELATFFSVSNIPDAITNLTFHPLTRSTLCPFSIFTSSTTEDDGNNNDEIPYCDEADPGYNGTCFDSQDYDEVTGLAPCEDGSQVQNYKDCPDRQDR
jgi:hypothetical protein